MLNKTNANKCVIDTKICTHTLTHTHTHTLAREMVISVKYQGFSWFVFFCTGWIQYIIQRRWEHRDAERQPDWSAGDEPVFRRAGQRRDGSSRAGGTKQSESNLILPNTSSVSALTLLMSRSRSPLRPVAHGVHHALRAPQTWKLLHAPHRAPGCVRQAYPFSLQCFHLTISHFLYAAEEHSRPGVINWRLVDSL